MKNKGEIISRKMLHLCMSFLELDTRTHFYGTDLEIHPAEIHIISKIAMEPGIHVIGLAKKMGVTKGNISQVIRKLEKKGLVEKRISETNQSRLSLYVTEKGMQAHKHHLEYHKKLDQITENALINASDENIVFLQKFFQDVSQKIIDMGKDL